MAKRQKEWARTARLNLIAALGGSCSACGSRENLELDCMTPMGDGHHRMDTSSRVSFYRRMHRAGNLQLLCARCNAAKGDMTQETWLAALRSAARDDESERALRLPDLVTGPDVPGAPFHYDANIESVPF